MDRLRPLDQDDEDQFDLAAAQLGARRLKPFTPPSIRAKSSSARHRSWPSPTTSDDHFLILRLGRSHEAPSSRAFQPVRCQTVGRTGYGMVVADGMGPYGPEIASRLAIAALVQLLLPFGKWNLRVNDRTAWEIVQRQTVLSACWRDGDGGLAATSSLAGMSTTLTAAYTAGDDCLSARRAFAGVPVPEWPPDATDADQTLAQRLAESKRTTPTELAAHRISVMCLPMRSEAAPASPTSKFKTTC